MIFFLIFIIKNQSINLKMSNNSDRANSSNEFPFLSIPGLPGPEYFSSNSLNGIPFLPVPGFPLGQTSSSSISSSNADQLNNSSHLSYFASSDSDYLNTPLLNSPTNKISILTSPFRRKLLETFASPNSTHSPIIYLLYDDTITNLYISPISTFLTYQNVTYTLNQFFKKIIKDPTSNSVINFSEYKYISRFRKFISLNHLFLVEHVEVFLIYSLILRQENLFDLFLKFAHQHQIKFSSLQNLSEHFKEENCLEVSYEIIRKLQNNPHIFSIKDNHTYLTDLTRGKEKDWLDFYIYSLTYNNFDRLFEYPNNNKNSSNKNNPVLNNLLTLTIKSYEPTFFNKLLEMKKIDPFLRLNNRYLIFRDLTIKDHYDFYQILNKHHPAEKYSIQTTQDQYDIITFAIISQNYKHLQTLLTNEKNKIAILNLAWKHHDLTVLKLILTNLDSTILTNLFNHWKTIISLHPTNLYLWQFIFQNSTILIEFEKLKLKVLSNYEFTIIKNFLLENFARFNFRRYITDKYFVNRFWNIENKKTRLLQRKNYVYTELLEMLCKYDHPELLEKFLNIDDQFKEHNSYFRLFEMTVKQKNQKIFKLLLNKQNNSRQLKIKENFKLFKFKYNDFLRELLKDETLDFSQIKIDLDYLYHHQLETFNIVMNHLKRFKIHVLQMLEMACSYGYIEQVKEYLPIFKTPFTLQNQLIQNIHYENNRLFLLAYQNLQVDIFRELLKHVKKEDCVMLGNLFDSSRTKTNNYLTLEMFKAYVYKMSEVRVFDKNDPEDYWLEDLNLEIENEIQKMRQDLADYEKALKFSISEENSSVLDELKNNIKDFKNKLENLDDFRAERRIILEKILDDKVAAEQAREQKYLDSLQDPTQFLYYAINYWHYPIIQVIFQFYKIYQIDLENKEVWLRCLKKAYFGNNLKTLNIFYYHYQKSFKTILPNFFNDFFVLMPTFNSRGSQDFIEFFMNNQIIDLNYQDGAGIKNMLKHQPDNFIYLSESYNINWQEEKYKEIIKANLEKIFNAFGLYQQNRENILQEFLNIKEQNNLEISLSEATFRFILKHNLFKSCFLLIEHKIIKAEHFNNEIIFDLIYAEKIDFLKMLMNKKLIVINKSQPINYLTLLEDKKYKVVEFLIGENIFQKENCNSEIIALIIEQGLIKILKNLIENEIIDASKVEIENLISWKKRDILKYLLSLESVRNKIESENKIFKILEELLKIDLAEVLKDLLAYFKAKIELLEELEIYNLVVKYDASDCFKELKEKKIIKIKKDEKNLELKYNFLELIYQDKLKMVKFLKEENYLKIEKIEKIEKINNIEISKEMAQILQLKPFDLEMAIIEKRYKDILTYLKIEKIKIIEKCEEECVICKDEENLEYLVGLNCGERNHFYHLNCLLISCGNLEKKCLLCFQKFEWRECKKVVIIKK